MPGVVVERIEPLFEWPDCYLVAGSGAEVILGHYNGRWMCGSPDEIHRGKGIAIDIVDGEKNLLTVSRAALGLWNQPGSAVDIRNKQAIAREQGAARWATLIKRGASGEGPLGTESTGEYLMVVAAGQMLSTGDPVLTILDRYSFNELTDIMNAMEEMGREGWRFPLVDRQP